MQGGPNQTTEITCPIRTVGEVGRAQRGVSGEALFKIRTLFLGGFVVWSFCLNGCQCVILVAQEQHVKTLTELCPNLCPVAACTSLVAS